MSQQKTSLTNTLLTALFGAVFIALFAQMTLSIPFGDNLIPLTGQSFAVLVFALSVGSRMGVYAVILYLLAGIAGLGVFAGGASGFEHFQGATGGYLYGFIFGALVTGWFADMTWDKLPVKGFLALLIGGIVILVIGFIHLNLVTDWDIAVENGASKTLLIGTTIKAAIGAFIWPLYHWINGRLEKKYTKMFG